MCATDLGHVRELLSVAFAVIGGLIATGFGIAALVGFWKINTESR